MTLHKFGGELLKKTREMSNDHSVEVMEQDQSDIRFQGDTILHIAARRNLVDGVTAILARDTMLHIAGQNHPLTQAINKFGETALIIACKYGHQDVVKELLEYYRQPDSAHEESYGGETSLLYAAVQGGCLNTVKAILDHPSAWQNDLMTKEDKCGRCPIHVAAIKGRLDIIEEFITRMPNCVEIYSSEHRSVLHFAVQYNKLDIVERLKVEYEERKLVSKDRDLSENTALHLAAKYGVSTKLLNVLLSFPGIEINAVNEEGMTALDIASAQVDNGLDIVDIVHILKRAKTHERILAPHRIPQETVNTHMVVASLIATVTFAAVFTVPGGIEDDKNSVHYGGAKLGLNKLIKIFILSDTTAFVTSLSVLVIWLIKRQWHKTTLGSFLPHQLANISQANLLLSIFWTAVAFMLATIIAVLPHDYDKLKSKGQKEAFVKYHNFLLEEIQIAVFAPYLIAVVFFIPKYVLFLPKLLIKMGTQRGLGRKMVNNNREILSRIIVRARRFSSSTVIILTFQLIWTTFLVLSRSFGKSKSTNYFHVWY